MQKIKVKDTVLITTGKDNGKTGEVEKVVSKGKSVRVVVSGANIQKKHQKTRQNQPGGIIEMPGLIDVSNVMLVCPHCQLKTRVGFRENDGKKQRYCKKCSKTI